jgi:peptidoglycan/xylan/chitin deacetylase (PgdA/CDA1 family)
MIGRIALGAGALWVGYAWGAHLAPWLAIRRGPTTGRRIALTFDDGPDPDWTPRVLDALSARDVRGTFFVVGERAARAPRVVRAIADAGHDVASHGWSHRSLWFCGPRRTEDEIARAQDLIADLTGREPTDFRPPWGMVNAALFPLLKKRGLRCVLWSIQPEGLRPADAEAQVSSVVGRAHPGAIVDLHDAEGTPRAPERLWAALPGMIDGLRRQDFELVTVRDLLDDGAGGMRGTRPLP